MSETKNNSKSGCLAILIVIVVAGYLMRGCFSTSVGIDDFAGDWRATGKEYNPFSMGGVIEKGFYPVEYELEIDSVGNYMLFYGSPGFLKLQRMGIMKFTDAGLIFPAFDLGDSRSDHTVQNVIVKDKRIGSFCTRAVGSTNEGCHIEFHK